MILDITLDQTLYEFVTIVKPCGITSKVTGIIVILVCRKRVHSSKLITSVGVHSSNTSVIGFHQLNDSMRSKRCQFELVLCR